MKRAKKTIRTQRWLGLKFFPSKIYKSKDEDSMDAVRACAERTFATGRNDGKRTADKIAKWQKEIVRSRKRFV